MKKFTATTFKLVGFFVLWIILLQITKINTLLPPEAISGNPALVEIWYQLLAMIAMVITSIIFIWLVDWGRLIPRFTAIGVRDFFFGGIIGFIWIGGTVGLLMVTSSIEFITIQKVPSIILWALAILLNTITVEYMFRGYAYSLLNKNYGPIAAVAIPAFIYLIFQGHVMSNGMLSILFVLASSILLSLMRYHTKSMLAPLFAHYIWNLVGGLIVGGVPLGSQYPVLLDKSLHGLTIITGGDSLFTGSAISLIVLINLIYLVILMMKDAKDPNAAKVFKRDELPKPNSKNAKGVAVNSGKSIEYGKEFTNKVDLNKEENATKEDLNKEENATKEDLNKEENAKKDTTNKEEIIKNEDNITKEESNVKNEDNITKEESNVINEDNLKKEESIKDKDNVINEDNIKKEDINNEDVIKKEDNNNSPEKEKTDSSFVK